jgi:hypothetical protein
MIGCEDPGSESALGILRMAALGRGKRSIYPGDNLEEKLWRPSGV